MMRKNIDIDNTTLKKLKVLSVLEDMSVKALMEKAVSFFVEYKQNQRFENMTEEEKEDLGLLMLMQQVDKNDTVTRDEIMEILDN